MHAALSHAQLRSELLGRHLHESRSRNLNSSAWIVCRLHTEQASRYLESAERLLRAQIQRLAAVA